MFMRIRLSRHMFKGVDWCLGPGLLTRVLALFASAEAEMLRESC